MKGVVCVEGWSFIEHERNEKRCYRMFWHETAYSDSCRTWIDGKGKDIQQNTFKENQLQGKDSVARSDVSSCNLIDLSIPYSLLYSWVYGAYRPHGYKLCNVRLYILCFLSATAYRPFIYVNPGFWPNPSALPPTAIYFKSRGGSFGDLWEATKIAIKVCSEAAVTCLMPCLELWQNLAPNTPINTCHDLTCGLFYYF